MFEDDGLDYYQSDGQNILGLYSSAELCRYAKEKIEVAHGVKITEIQLEFGHFVFSISASDNEDLYIPMGWTPRSFGKGVINFEMPIDVFQERYFRFEERDLIDTVRATFQRVHGSICDVVSVKHQNDPMFEGGVELVIKLKPGCKYINTSPWLPVNWVQGDMICFEIGEDDIRSLIETYNK